MSAASRFRELISTDEPVAVLAGSGISVPHPSNLPSGYTFTRLLLAAISPDTEVEHALLHLTNPMRDNSRARGDFIRFEGLMKVVRDSVDRNLDVLSWLSQCDRPNDYHYALAHLLRLGHRILTTNFDILIERALLDSGASFTVLFEDAHYASFTEAAQGTLFKLHGSVAQMEEGAWQDSRHSVQATLNEVGISRAHDSASSAKSSVFSRLLQAHHLVVLGYSGFDDFDICPIIRQTPSAKSILWVNHSSASDDYVSWEKLSEKVRRSDGSPRSGKHEELLFSLADASSPSGAVRQPDAIHLFNMNTALALHGLGAPGRSAPDSRSSGWHMDMESFFRNWRKEHVPSKGHQHFLCATLFNSLGYLDRAFAQYSSARKEFEASGHHHGAAQSLHNMGVIFTKWGHLDDAMICYEQSVTIKRTANNPFGIAQGLHSIGIIHQRRNEFDEARRCYEESLNIRRELNDKPGIAMTLHQLGRVYERRNELDVALDYYNASKTVELDVGNKEGLATSLYSIGSIHRKMNRLDEATRECLAARDLSEELGDVAGLASACYELGRIIELRKDYPEAIRLYLESLRYEEMVGDEESIGVTECQLGLLHRDLGDMACALEWLTKARNRFTATSSSRLADVERALESLKSM